MLPVLLVHGIWDTGAKLAHIAHALEQSGAPRAESISLTPNDGSAALTDLARQVATEAEKLGPKIDLVGFSMGALISRIYLQRLGGRDRVRRFVSIAGPHAGTLWARFAKPELLGVRDMRPGSALLRDLASDADPFGHVEVHTIWTPFDLMIVPPSSSRLATAKSERRIRIGMHRWVVNDARTIAHVLALLSAP